MLVFAFSCAVAMFIILINLVNWMWRSVVKSGEDNLVGVAFILTILAVIAYFLLKYIIIWGSAISIFQS